MNENDDRNGRRGQLRLVGVAVMRFHFSVRTTDAGTAGRLVRVIGRTPGPRRVWMELTARIFVALGVEFRNRPTVSAAGFSYRLAGTDTPYRRQPGPARTERALLPGKIRHYGDQDGPGHERHHRAGLRLPDQQRPSVHAGSATSRTSSGPSLTFCAVTTSRPTTGRSSCR